jgi:hypothetical protein
MNGRLINHWLQNCRRGSSTFQELHGRGTMASNSVDASEQRLHPATRTLHKEMRRFRIRSFGSIWPVSCRNNRNAQVSDKPYKNLAPEKGSNYRWNFQGCIPHRRKTIPQRNGMERTSIHPWNWIRASLPATEGANPSIDGARPWRTTAAAEQRDSGGKGEPSYKGRRRALELGCRLDGGAAAGDRETLVTSPLSWCRNGLCSSVASGPGFGSGRVIIRVLVKRL